MPVVAVDRWQNFEMGPTVPPLGAVAITPSDTDELANMVRALEVTVAGNVAVVFRDGSAMTLVFAAGERKTGFFKQVKATNTTATGIYGLI